MNWTLKNRWGLLLFAAAVLTLSLKFVAWDFSQSIGIFSDAVESLGNLTTALLAWLALAYTRKPADAEHSYGHEKIEYFSSGIEGALIIVAAVWIVAGAIDRFLHPRPLSQLPLSMAITVAAAVINWGVGKFLLQASRRQDSIILEASGRHLLADFWTTVAVVIGLILFMITQRAWLDPLMAILVAFHVIGSGVMLVLRSFRGLMDFALPAEELKIVTEIIQRHAGARGKFHALRSRKSGARRFIDFHLLLPGEDSLQHTHAMTLAIEQDLERLLKDIDVTIHLEPVEDPASWEENTLSRRV